MDKLGKKILDGIGQIVQYPRMETETFNWELVDAVAESLGVSYFTRRKWRDRNRVPVHWWQPLSEASDGKLTTDAFQSLILSAKPAPAQSPEAA